MSFREWLKDLWLDIRYGWWVVEREQVVINVPLRSLVPLKREGHQVIYDRGMDWQYYAVCRRSGDKLKCGSKREAEGVAAINNDSRGLEDINPNGC